MSNHFSAANLKFPGDDARLDLTDLFVFQSPSHPGKTVLIMNSNPFMTGSEFHPDAVYRINIDNDGDVQADVAFTFVFSQPQNGRQTATAFYATGSDARQPEPTGEILVKSTPVGFDAIAQPAQDREHYLEAWSGTLQEQGSYSPEDADAAALAVLPDVLRYDRSLPAVYPNGRTPVDDVYDAMLTILTGGKITSDGVGPHNDL